MSVVRLFMAISADHGVVTSWFVKTPFNSDHMVNFLRAISNQTWKKTWIFMDNASYHKSRKTRQELKRIRMQLIYNKAYNPEYNPIENVFG